MIIAIDNNVLIALVSSKVDYQNLETFLYQNQATLLIPTPVISEFVAYDFNQRRQQLLAIPYNKVVKGSFDDKAAYMCGDFAHRIDKGLVQGRKQKVKVDLQILAIAVANGAQIILSEDTELSKSVKNLGLEIEVIETNKLKLGLDLFDNVPLVVTQT